LTSSPPVRRPGRRGALASLFQDITFLGCDSGDAMSLTYNKS
jgi:hypothetical protein